jgi:hypothetical protein
VVVVVAEDALAARPKEVTTMRMVWLVAGLVALSVAGAEAAPGAKRAAASRCRPTTAWGDA